MQQISKGFWPPSAILCQMVLCKLTSLPLWFHNRDGSTSLFSQQNVWKFSLLHP
jgi:hypothetical protein